jgi:hypothetical protein
MPAGGNRRLIRQTVSANGWLNVCHLQTGCTFHHFLDLFYPLPAPVDDKRVTVVNWTTYCVSQPYQGHPRSAIFNYRLCYFDSLLRFCHRMYKFSLLDRVVGSCSVVIPAFPCGNAEVQGSEGLTTISYSLRGALPYCFVLWWFSMFSTVRLPAIVFVQ